VIEERLYALSNVGRRHSMAQRAGAKITELEGSHVIMISQPQAMTDVILEALSEVRAQT
jgi:hypothetical protein